MTQFALPTFHTATDRFEHEIVQMFLHCYEEKGHGRGEIRILSSIHAVADISGHGDAYIAKLLVDHGLRAPRMAFPQEFLDHVDQSCLRQGRANFSTLSSAYKSLMDFWVRCGDDIFAFVRQDYRRQAMPSFLRA